MGELPKLIAESEVKRIFQFFQNQIDRQAIVVSVIALRPVGETPFEKLQQMLLETARSSNLYFLLSKDVIGIVLYEATQKDAQFYLKRLERDFPQLTWQASICELRQKVADFQFIKEELIEQLPTTTTIFEKNISTRFSQRKKMKKKVSIVEANDVARHMLENAIHTIKLPNVEIALQTFSDGEAFLASDWYQSEHEHIVLLNAKLPRKNGLQVVSELRDLPNDRKFSIFLMSRLPAAEDQISAYEHGVDAYIVRPFNLGVLSAQVKQKLMRRTHK